MFKKYGVKRNKKYLIINIDFKFNAFTVKSNFVIRCFINACNTNKHFVIHSVITNNVYKIKMMN